MSDSPLPSGQVHADVTLTPDLTIRITPLLDQRTGRPFKVDVRLFRATPVNGQRVLLSTSAGFHLPIAKVDEFIVRLRTLVSQVQG